MNSLNACFMVVYVSGEFTSLVCVPSDIYDVVASTNVMNNFANFGTQQ
jgi:hypothetical protein